MTPKCNLARVILSGAKRNRTFSSEIPNDATHRLILAMLGFKRRSLSLQHKADTVRIAACNLGIVITAVGSLEYDLDFLACAHGVIAEQSPVKGYARSAFDAEIGVAVRIRLESAILPVKIIREGQRMIHAASVGVSKLKPVGIGILSASRVEVKRKAGKHRLDVNADLRNSERNILFHIAALDRQLLHAAGFWLVVPLRAIER